METKGRAGIPWVLFLLAKLSSGPTDLSIALVFLHLHSAVQNHFSVTFFSVAAMHGKT